jgi:dephospho-CoA kinase
MAATTLRVGLTGNIGAGKSTVAGLLDGPGFLIVAADRLGHMVLQEDGEAREQIVAQLGADILDATGSIDRTLLGQLVFRDPAARKRLEAIVHPRIRASEEACIAAWGMPEGIAVTEAALLVETAGNDRYHRLVVVSAPPQTRIERLTARGMSKADTERRMAAQMPDAKKAAAADYVVDNGDTPESTATQVATIREHLLEDLRALCAGLSLPPRQR